MSLTIKRKTQPLDVEAIKYNESARDVVDWVAARGGYARETTTYEAVRSEVRPDKRVIKNTTELWVSVQDDRNLRMTHEERVYPGMLVVFVLDQFHVCNQAMLDETYPKS